MSENTSRREFLKLAGKGVLGAAALSTVPAMLPALAEGVEAPAWPWAMSASTRTAAAARALWRRLSSCWPRNTAIRTTS